MNEKQPIYIIVGLFGLIFILVVIFVSVYFTPKKPVSIRPRAEKVGHRLGFHVADRVNPTVRDEVALTPGKPFSLLIMLSNGAALEQDKKYKFHLKFDYNGDVLTLNVPRNRKLNNEEFGNGDIIKMHRLFTELELNRVEEENGKIEIEGWFKSDSYASLAQSTGARNSDRIVIVELRQFEVKQGVSLTDDTQLFSWYRDGVTKVSRVDATFVNPDEDLRLELVDKDKGDIVTSETAVVPQEGVEITQLGEIKATPVPEAGTTVTGGAAMTVNLSLRFQGILQKPDERFNRWPVRVTVDGGTLASPVAKTAEFVAGEGAIWTGSVAFSEIPAGSSYRILIKGPKHLQKKICEAAPTETYPGSYSCRAAGITLTAGVNTLDFSKIYLLAGDLPEQGGAQNGFVNSFDLSLIRNNIGNTDPQVLQWADLNLDGVINTQDFSLVIAALEFRTDEQ